MKRLIWLLAFIILICSGIYTMVFAETSSPYLSGAKDLSCRVGETICFKKSDFHMYPNGTLINGRVSYEDASFDVWSYNYLFHGNSEYYTEITADGDEILYIRPIVPGYYSMYAYVYYEEEDEYFTIDSDYFMLTVLDENGNTPEPDPISVEIFPISSVNIGERIQINWSEKGYEPIHETIRILTNGHVIEMWDYEDNYKDTYVFTSTGTYQVQMSVTDGLGRTITKAIDITVGNQTKALDLKSLEVHIGTDKSVEGMAIYPRQIEWNLDYEGGRGSKTTEIHLINTETYEDIILFEDDFFPSFSAQVGNGTFFIRMNVKDNEGDHWIESNLITTIPSPDWSFVLPYNIKKIEANAFEKIAAPIVYVNYGCKSIGENAFANSSIIAIFIPPTVTSIGDNAIPERTIIYAIPYSWAAKWALAHNYVVIYDL